MDAVDSITLAGKLAASADAGEPAYRTAASRAYYEGLELDFRTCFRMGSQLVTRGVLTWNGSKFRIANHALKQLAAETDILKGMQ
jgi:hypothetical protein